MAEVSEDKNTGFDVQQTLGTAEMFFEKNKKMIGYVGTALAVIVGAVIAYKMWYIPEQDKEAQSQIWVAESLYDKDSLSMALKAGNYDGIAYSSVEDIADEYGSTPTGNLAEYMTGTSLLQQGKFEEAIEHLENFSSNDIMLSAVVLGAIGDAKMELKESDEAIKYYLKAADKNTNNFITPIYLKKAGFGYEGKGEYAEALKLYQRIQTEFPKSTEGRDIEKHIMRVKTLGNL